MISLILAIYYANKGVNEWGVCGLVPLELAFYFFVGSIIKDSIDKRQAKKQAKKQVIINANLAKAETKMKSVECQRYEVIGGYAEPDYSPNRSQFEQTAVNKYGADFYYTAIKETKNTHPRGSITWGLWNEIHNIKETEGRHR